MHQGTIEDEFGREVRLQWGLEQGENGYSMVLQYWDQDRWTMILSHLAEDEGKILSGAAVIECLRAWVQRANEKIKERWGGSSVTEFEGVVSERIILEGKQFVLREAE